MKLPKGAAPGSFISSVLSVFGKDVAIVQRASLKYFRVETVLVSGCQFVAFTHINL